MRSSVPLLLGALALGMVGCMRESEPAPNVVVQRVDEIRTTAGSRLPASPLLRDSSWRSGFSLPVGESFEVAADARARELLFAIAAGAKAPLRFDVSVFEGGTWRSLFRETLPSGSLGVADPAGRASDRAGRVAAASLRDDGRGRLRGSSVLECPDLPGALHGCR